LEKRKPLDFLKQYSGVSTKRNYKSAYRDLFQVVYGQRDPVEELAEKYVGESREHRQDIEDFLVSLKGMAPKTIRTKITAVRTFLIENDIDINTGFWTRISKRIKGSRALTIDQVPTHEQFRKVFNHLVIAARALFIVLLSSGMRIGEALKLKPGDLELNRDPVRVNVRGEYTKTGNPRVTFISREAKEIVEEWLKVRDEYLQQAVSKTGLYDKDPDDPRLFPFSHANAYVMWNEALRKSGFDKRDESTNRHTVHPHTLRKFFRTKLAAVISVDVVEALMGHEGYLTEVYRRYSMEDLAGFYKQGEHALLVFTESGEVSKLREEVVKQRDQLQAIVNGVTAENMTLRAKVETQEAKIERQELEMEKLRGKIDRVLAYMDELEKS